jgi:hypothetical protein
MAPAPVEAITDPPVEDDDAKPADMLTCAAVLAAEPPIRDAEADPRLPSSEAPVRKTTSPDDPETALPDDTLAMPLAPSPAAAVVTAFKEPELAT